MPFSVRTGIRRGSQRAEGRINSEVPGLKVFGAVGTNRRRLLLGGPLNGHHLPRWRGALEPRTEANKETQGWVVVRNRRRDRAGEE